MTITSKGNFSEEDLAFLGLDNKASVAHVHSAWRFRTRALANQTDRSSVQFVQNYQRLISIGHTLKRIFAAS